MLGSVSQKAWSLSFSPIHRLPDEVLARILHLCMLCGSGSNEPQQSPRTFTHVCRRWTQVALSNKSLWRTITMSFPLSPAQFIETNIRLMRSQPYPLDIHLDFRDPLWDWDEETHQFGIADMSSVIRTLIPHIGRWRALEVLTDTWAPMFCLLLTTSCMVHAAPMLETIKLSRCNAYFAITGETFTPRLLQTPMKLFGGAPLDKLRHVSLVGVHIDWRGSQLAGLHQLELKYHASNVMPSPEEFVHILVGCPRLNKLSLVGWGPRLENLEDTECPSPCCPHAGKAITLDHLVRFSLGFVDVNYATKLLSLFHFPALHELELEDVSLTLNPFEERDSSPILKFLTENWQHQQQRNETANSTPGAPPVIPLDQITYLELRGVCAARDALVPFLRCTATVEHLVLRDTCEDAVFALGPGSLPFLHPPGKDGVSSIVCPELRVLHCQGVDCSAIAKVLDMRYRGTSKRLEVLKLEPAGDAI